MVIYQAVKNRGYRNGYAPAHFILRQLVKLVEEICGAMEVERQAFPPSLMEMIKVVKGQAKQTFDNDFIYPFRAASGKAVFSDWIEKDKLEAILSELADIQVVLACAAMALGEERGQPVDIMAEAMKKATADVKRGVRNDAHSQ
jgi:hypothetical protein